MNPSLGAIRPSLRLIHPSPLAITTPSEEGLSVSEYKQGSEGRAGVGKSNAGVDLSLAEVNESLAGVYEFLVGVDKSLLARWSERLRL